MRKPKEPQLPYKPIEPQEYYEVPIEIDIPDSETLTLKELMERNKHKFPNFIDYENIRITLDKGWEGDHLELTYSSTKKKNPLYASLMKDYKREIKKYEQDILSYKEKLEKYKQDMIPYLEWKKSVDKKQKQQQINRLKQQLRKLEND